MAEIGILDAEDEGRVSPRLGQERVDEMDVRFPLEQGAQAVGHLLGTLAQRDDEDLHAIEGDASLDEDGLDGGGIAHDQAHHGAVDRILDGQSQNDDMAGAQQIEDGDEGSGAVREEHGELPHRGTLDGGGKVIFGIEFGHGWERRTVNDSGPFVRPEDGAPASAPPPVFGRLRAGAVGRGPETGA